MAGKISLREFTISQKDESWLHSPGIDLHNALSRGGD
jgi:hypothetical protein